MIRESPPPPPPQKKKKKITQKHQQQTKNLEQKIRKSAFPYPATAHNGRAHPHRHTR